ncbi:hypothetical protein D7B24_006374 [Verticillium nonalfalfae]|uniref:Target of rapamycin complex 2 subunit bit61 n=1 Tax=Verticillium nonalfalfae TaxID=1051616 RepID=A0A3M9Y9E1_9PEZI|nr:uncharacterized protein D7B24_006374 [Verticillium nonalfalfae]RNJ57099.1 hypothetical protein D7B24_006374 [Verticillium nonalfalfae]
MQPARPNPRAPGSFSPLAGSAAAASSAAAAMHPPQRPRPAPRLDSESSEDLTLNVSKQRNHAPSAPAGTPIYSQFASQNNGSTASLQNFSRPTAQRPHINTNDLNTTSNSSVRTASPLTKSYHSRKHSQTQGLFEPTLPSTSTSNLSHISMVQPPAANLALTASQIAAQAAFQHQNNSAHTRQRSQTVPAPGEDGARRGSNGKGPLSPPILSLTEASGPRESGFGNHSYHNGLLNHSSAAHSAANAAYPRSGQSSPGLPQHPSSPILPPQPQALDQRPAKLEKEKSKVKLFSRPVKIGTKGESKEKPLPSPSKIGSAFASLQRGNFSTNSLVDPSAQSIYSLNNSSSATIRPVDTLVEREGKEKEKKHNFLSRQKNKLKEDYHLPLSSASSNSKPTDPNAPTSLYSFNIPAGQAAATSSSFAKGRKDRKTERSDSRLDSESTLNLQSEWPAPGSLPSASSYSLTPGVDPTESGKYGLNNMSLDDAWPFLKAKMLVIFEGEDLRQPVEDYNRLVNLHIQYCIQRRSPTIMLEDLRELLMTGFASLDHTLRRTQEDKVIPALVEMWLITYTSILPYMQAVFLPLDLEFSGCGALMTPEQAYDFWGGVLDPAGDGVNPASSVLDIRRIVLAAYRDRIILPRFENLKTIFSRLSLEFLPSSFGNMALASDSISALSSSPATQSELGLARPGTAMSLDPSLASYGSTSTTLLGEAVSAAGSNGGNSGNAAVSSRSRAISNVSYASGGSDQQLRPFTPSSGAVGSQQVLGSVREQNVEDSKQVTEMVGRMLQCMSILASVGVAGDGSDEGNKKMEELCRLLKLNWLGRGRTGRNRRGMVGGRVRRDVVPEGTREGVRV